MIREITKRKCAVCGAEFMVWSNHVEQQSCSVKCGGILRARRIKALQREQQRTTLAEILAKAQKYHPEEFAQLPWGSKEWSRHIRKEVMREIAKGQSGQPYEWFYNHAICPDCAVAGKIFEALRYQRKVLGL